MFCNLVQRLALPILVALATLTPIRSDALVQSPTLPGSPSDLSVLVEEVPEYVAVLVETPEGLCWVICRNDPINSTDPLGLDVFQYEGAKILGLVEAPSGYAPYFRGTTFIEDVGAQIANAGSLFANTFWNTLEGVNCVVTVVDESPKALGGSKTITQMQEPLGPLAFATGGGELKVAMVLGSLSRVARIEGVVARGVVLEKSVVKAAKSEVELVNLASKQRTTHILQGDKSGGGHLFPGKPRKSPFPQDWSGDRIMHEISDVATDPLATRLSGRGGRTVVRGTRGGVDIEVILESPQKGGGVVTGYPTNLGRNP